MLFLKWESTSFAFVISFVVSEISVNSIPTTMRTNYTSKKLRWAELEGRALNQDHKIK